MCGIAGYSGEFDQALLERMNEAIAHRGPDDAGTLALEGCAVGLAHRRLSIIDLSSRGHQPMWDATGSVAIVYNGEIYNYRELRRELVTDGYEFNSDTDTEVLLNLYRRDGKKMLERLNGIFAFALFDAERKTLLLARDGMGVKPLYYAQTPHGFLFASEIKALLQDPGIDRTLDQAAVHHHLIYLWCPAPLTMLEGVHKLEPGCAMTVKDGRVVETWTFYDLPFDEEFVDWPAEDAIVQVRKYLTQAVERQLVADVTVGAFLSGGLDSSAVVALAQRRMGDEKLQCFTIGFPADGENEGMAEDLPYARRVAQHLGVDLHTIEVGPQMVEELPKMIFHLDEPQADPAPINALYISQLAREHGIKVLLSGAGGDDIFTGYRRHHALIREPLWSWLPHTVRRGISTVSAGIHPTTDFRRRLSKLLRNADLAQNERITSYFQWISPDVVESVLSEPLRPDFPSTLQNGPVPRALNTLGADVPPINRMLYLEGKFFLADHNLNYVDKVSMASGVEVRVPLLDPDLTKLAARLPVHYKQRGNVGKWVLRKAVEPYLPRNVIYRPKTGFGAPLRSWLRGDLRPIVDELLSEPSIRQRGLFDAAGVAKLLTMDRERQIDATYTLFSMICVELWCRMFVDVPTPRPL